VIGRPTDRRARRGTFGPTVPVDVVSVVQWGDVVTELGGIGANVETMTDITRSSTVPFGVSFDEVTEAAAPGKTSFVSWQSDQLSALAKAFGVIA
jgi:hypothetical protein